LTVPNELGLPVDKLGFFQKPFSLSVSSLLFFCFTVLGELVLLH